MYEYTRIVKSKGWTNRKLAVRWGLSANRISQIAKHPKVKDWDALNGIPVHNKKVKP